MEHKPLRGSQESQPLAGVPLMAQEKERDNEGARGEIMSWALDMFSFRKWWDTQVEIFCKQKETQD